MDSFALRAGALALALLVALAVGLWRRRTDGSARAVRDGHQLTAADLGAPLGVRATLLQFSAPVCAPCRSAREVLGAASSANPGVTHVELDAAERLDLVRRLGILRTPTVLVLDGAGRVVARSAGAPTRQQVLTWLSPLTNGVPA